MNGKIKPTINGNAETMLQSFYARAQYSKSKHHKFYDAYKFFALLPVAKKFTQKILMFQPAEEVFTGSKKLK